jgi:hypothetical protein
MREGRDQIADTYNFLRGKRVPIGDFDQGGFKSQCAVAHISYLPPLPTPDTGISASFRDIGYFSYSIHGYVGAEKIGRDVF